MTSYGALAEKYILSFSCCGVFLKFIAGVTFFCGKILNTEGLRSIRLEVEGQYDGEWLVLGTNIVYGHSLMRCRQQYKEIVHFVGFTS